MPQVSCNHCKLIFYKSNCFLRKRNFCSRICHHEGMKIGRFLDCIQCKKKYYRPLSTVNHVGRRKSKFCSLVCRYKNMETRNIGKESYFWKGGISKINRTERANFMATAKYKQWRRKIFKRDNFTCRICGASNKKGNGKTVILNADHIKPFALYPEKRLLLSNGRTLCIKCHRNTKTFGRSSLYRKN